MKSNVEFDKAFREKLGHHAETPPPGMWESIELMIPTVVAPSGRRVQWLWWSGAAVLLLMSALTIWSYRSTETLVMHFIRTEPAILNFNAPVVTITQNAFTDNPQKKGGEERLATKHDAPSANPYLVPSTTTTSQNKQTIGDQTKKPSLISESTEEYDVIPLDNDEAPSDNPMGNIKEETKVVSEPSTEVNISSESSIEPLVSNPEELKKNIDPTSAKDLKRVFMPKAYIGTYYMPELTIHKGDIPKENSWSHGAGARIGIEYRGLLAESGVNISTSHDNWQYSVDYLSRDSVGWYWDVQWVNFIPLTNQYGDTIGYEPQYQVVQTAFYDSVEHQHAEAVEGTYRYYHIPLMFGVTRPVPIAKGLTYSIKGGVIYSRLNYEPDLNETFNNSSIRVLHVDDGRYYRQRSTLQWMTSVEMRYYLTAKFAVFVEPMARFYRDPYYYRPDDSELQHPYSMSMRVGLHYRF